MKKMEYCEFCKKETKHFYMSDWSDKVQSDCSGKMPRGVCLECAARKRAEEEAAEARKAAELKRGNRFGDLPDLFRRIYHTNGAYRYTIERNSPLNLVVVTLYNSCTCKEYVGEGIWEATALRMALIKMEKAVKRWGNKPKEANNALE